VSLTPCPECGREVSTQAVACPHCGAPIARARGTSVFGVIGKVLLVLIILFALFLIAGLALSDTTPEERRAKARERDAIDLCRREQADELKDLSERRFIRAACDKMEADFRAKHGVSP